MKIYKYEISPFGETMVKVPRGSKVLSVQTQRDAPFLWIAHSNNKDLVERYFCAYPTGESPGVSPIMTYIGTYQWQDGNLVAHLFEITK